MHSDVCVHGLSICICCSVLPYLIRKAGDLSKLPNIMLHKIISEKMYLICLMLFFFERKAFNIRCVNYTVIVLYVSTNVLEKSKESDFYK